jgi:ABC-2 type transport system permease protein
MSIRKTIATAKRVLSQLKHDPRTIGLVIMAPILLITILKYVFQGEPQVFDTVAPMMLGIFPLLMMFLITSVATLRERTTGTLDRLMTEPMSKLDLVFGYALAFSLFVLVQGAAVGFVTLGLLGVTVMGGTIPVLIAAVLAALLGIALGLFVSAFATSEFQAVQLVIPAVFPQVLVCGLFVPREHMAKLLQWLADVFPVTYSVDAMKQVTVHSQWGATLTRDLLVVVGYAVVALVLGSITIRRQDK